MGVGKIPQEAYDHYVRNVRIYSEHPAKHWKDCLFEETTPIKVKQVEVPVTSTTTVLLKDTDAPRS